MRTTGSVHEHGCHLVACLLELGGVEVQVGRHGGEHGGGGRGRLLAVGGGGLQRVLLGALGVEAFEEAAQVLQPRPPNFLRREACEGAARERTLVLLPPRKASERRTHLAAAGWAAA